ncbi:MAG: hypothetical protein FWE31_02145 [Firmicutes bacterium]|nr:hypothetical protein [Bacillota bacterium]
MITQNILIIYNPNSGKGRGERFANRLQRALTKRKYTVGEVFRSDSTERVYEFCEASTGNPKEFSMAIIIGGDGTLSPWVDAMIKNNFRVPVYAFGRGTANDFSAFLRTCRSIRKVCKIIKKGQVVEMDTLHINNESFGMNVACGGAFTNGVTAYSKRGKLVFGKLAYMYKAMGAAIRMRAQDVRFTVDGREIQASVYLFLILNSPNAGSIRRISRTARPWSGEFELVAIKRCGFWGKMGLALYGLFGWLSKNKHVVCRTGKEFTVEVVGEPNRNFTKTDIDGNKGGDYPLHVRVSDEKIPFVTNRW